MEEDEPTPSEYERVTSVDAALDVERRVIECVRRRDREGQRSFDVNTWTYVIAVDVAYDPRSSLTVASAVLWDVRRATVIDECVERKTKNERFPYTPGLLAFREIPSLVRITQRLLLSRGRHAPCLAETLLLCDGNGTLHPRRCGVACHLGLLLGMSSVGVAKNFYVATALSGAAAAAALPSSRGERTLLYIDNLPSGFVVRTQDGVRPIYVSPGFNMPLDQVCHVVLTLTSTFRQPDAIRRADHIGRMELKNDGIDGN